MIPPSVYKVPLSYIPEHRNCLVVDDDTDLLNEYELLLKGMYTFASIERVSQNDAATFTSNHQYDCIIVDNDSFKIGEYRGLETVKKLIASVSPNKIIYTSALPDEQMRNATKDFGVHFVEKGRWRKLEEIMKGLLDHK